MHPSPAHTGEPDLLDVVQGFVERDGAPAGFRGRLAIGVCGATRIRFWVADFDRRVSSCIAATPPAQMDAVLLLGETESQRILRGEALPEHALVDIAGDQRLVERFVTRYFGGASLLGTRIKNSRPRSP